MLISKPRTSSRSFFRFIERMRVTSNHMRVVNKALSEMRERKTDDARSRQDRQIANHAIAHNAGIALQFAYGHFIAYLKSVLREMYYKKPLEIVGKAPATLAYHEVVKLGSYESICDYMVNQVFRSIEGKRNTRGLLLKILDKTNVSIDDEVMNRALMYIEVRHLLVHNSGKVDANFAEHYGPQLRVREGQALKGNIGGSNHALKAIAKLCLEIDQGLLVGGFINAVGRQQLSGSSQDEVMNFEEIER